jgi:DNA-binding FadR family transcriptional regulator
VPWPLHIKPGFVEDRQRACSRPYVGFLFRCYSRPGFARADLRLHLALLDASGNPFMHSVGNLIEAALATSFALSSPTEDPLRAALSAGVHRRIVEAIEKRDADAAAAAVEAVIVEGRDRVAGRIIGKRRA